MRIGNILENTFGAQVVYDAMVDEEFLSRLSKDSGQSIKDLLSRLWYNAVTKGRIEPVHLTVWKNGIRDALERGGIDPSEDLVDDIAFDQDAEGVEVVIMTDADGVTDIMDLEAVIPAQHLYTNPGFFYPKIAITPPPSQRSDGSNQVIVMDINPFGGSGDATSETPSDQTGGDPPSSDEDEEKKSDTGLYLGAVVGGLLAVGIYAYLKR